MRNINFEDDTRHSISDRALRNMKETMYSQDEFGVKKYGEPLNFTMGYDWLEMAQEEIADMLKYLECERVRKAAVIDLLRKGIANVEVRDWCMKEALEILSTGGTGK